MAHLTLAGLSEDGKRLLLVDDHGTEHTLTVDRTLRSVLRGEHVSLGQLEIQMDSALRPRDIQARIRAGETPEAVAQAAQTTVDRIMAFAGPVLAERAHVADRAQRASLRPPAGDGGSRTLGETVGRHLAGLDVGEDSVEWDARRREDGRWVLTGTFSVPSRTGIATFTFDAPGNFVVAEDEDASWLVGEQVETPAAGGEDRRRRTRRLASVSAAEELPLGEDAIEMVSDHAGEAGAAPAEEPDGSGTSGRTDPDVTAEPASASPFLDAAFRRQSGDPGPVDGASPVDSQPVHETAEGQASDADPDQTSQDAPEEGSEPPRRQVSKKRGRASVPSWDEIMFGGPDSGS